MNEVVIFYAHHRLMRLYVSLLCSLLFLISLSTKCVNSTNFIGFKHWITISYHEHCSQIYTLNIYYCSHHVRHKQWLCSVAQSYPTLWHPIAHQAHQSMGFSRQEYWNVLPFPSPRDLPGPEIEPMSPALARRFFNTEPSGKPWKDGSTS